MKAMVTRLGIVLVALLVFGGCAEFGRTGSSPVAPPPKVSLRICLASTEARDGFQRAQDERGDPLYVAPTAVLTEVDVKRASVMESRKRAIVVLEFKPLASDRLDRETRNHIGDRLAIFVDDQLVVSPRISGRTGSSKAVVNGDFTKERASEIARALNSGAAAPATRPAP